MICTRAGKVMYATRHDAQRAAVRFKERKKNSAHVRKSNRREKALEPYHCEHCDLFHIGHRREQRKGAGGRVKWALGKLGKRSKKR
jgi:hypothetical protein